MTEQLAPIKQPILSFEQTFANAVALAGSRGEKERQRMKQQASALLAYKMERYTMGESTSVKEERANSLMEGIGYTLGAALQRYQDAAAAQLLLQAEWQTIYLIGRAVLDKKLRQTKVMWRTLRACMVKTPSLYYKSTLQEGLASFFAAYDVDFAPQEDIITYDYPACLLLPEVNGVQKTEFYIQAMLLENHFLMRFAPQAIHRALLRADAEYIHTPFNLFEAVLRAALGCVLSGTEPASLAPSRMGLMPMQKDIKNGRQQIQQAAKQLCNAMCIPGGELQAYLQKAADQLANTMLKLPPQNMPVFLLVVKEKYTEKTIKYSDAPKLADKDFRELAYELESCRYQKDRLEMIRALPSLADWIDILDAEVLRPGDAAKLFATMQKEELALLLHHLPLWNEQQEDRHHLDKPWQGELRSCLQGMTSDERKEVQQIQDSLAE